MILFTPSESDWGIAAAVLVIIATLVYRLLRHEPLDRIVRLGMFIERKRFGDADNGKPHPPEDEKTTEETEWPHSGT